MHQPFSSASSSEKGAALNQLLDACDTLSHPIFLHDHEFRILFANRAYLSRAKASLVDILGRPYWQVFPRAQGPLGSCLRALTDGSETEVEDIRTDAGEVFCCRALAIHGADGRYLYSIHLMYDFAHGQSDAIEGITHSICTLEFAGHRPLYDWFVAEVGLEPAPRQIEFARLNLSHTVMSKRMLRQLVERGHVRGWDDPRMPTLAGLRRRGYTPASLRRFCEGIGVAKRDNVIELARLEHDIRQDLNPHAPRVMGVLRPLKVVIENFAEGEVDWLDAVNNP